MPYRHLQLIFVIFLARLVHPIEKDQKWSQFKRKTNSLDENNDGSLQKLKYEKDFIRDGYDHQHSHFYESSGVGVAIGVNQTLNDKIDDKMKINSVNRQKNSEFSLFNHQDNGKNNKPVMLKLTMPENKPLERSPLSSNSEQKFCSQNQGCKGMDSVNNSLGQLKMKGNECFQRIVRRIPSDIYKTMKVSSNDDDVNTGFSCNRDFDSDDDFPSHRGNEKSNYFKSNINMNGRMKSLAMSIDKIFGNPVKNTTKLNNNGSLLAKKPFAKYATNENTIPFEQIDYLHPQRYHSVMMKGLTSNSNSEFENFHPELTNSQNSVEIYSRYCNKNLTCNNEGNNYDKSFRNQLKVGRVLEKNQGNQVARIASANSTTVKRHRKSNSVSEQLMPNATDAILNRSNLTCLKSISSELKNITLPEYEKIMKLSSEDCKQITSEVKAANSSVPAGKKEILKGIVGRSRNGSSKLPSRLLVKKIQSHILRVCNLETKTNRSAGDVEDDQLDDAFLIIPLNCRKGNDGIMVGWDNQEQIEHRCRHLLIPNKSAVTINFQNSQNLENYENKINTKGMNPDINTDDNLKIISRNGSKMAHTRLSDKESIEQDIKKPYSTMRIPPTNRWTMNSSMKPEMYAAVMKTPANN